MPDGTPIHVHQVLQEGRGGQLQYQVLGLQPVAVAAILPAALHCASALKFSTRDALVAHAREVERQFGLQMQANVFGGQDELQMVQRRALLSCRHHSWVSLSHRWICLGRLTFGTVVKLLGFMQICCQLYKATRGRISTLMSLDGCVANTILECTDFFPKQLLRSLGHLGWLCLLLTPKLLAQSSTRLY